MSPIFVGGRRILGALSADPTTGLTEGDEYYNTTTGQKKIYNGSSWSDLGSAGGLTAFSSVESAISNWAFLPNEDFYTSTNVIGTNYNGSRYRVTNGTGRVEANTYEYPLFGKFATRTSANDSVFFQLYNFAGTASSFNSGVTNGNLFQMGFTFDTIPTSLLTNSLEATSAIAAGGVNWIATDGYGTKTWAFYNGAASNNSQPQGSTNREQQLTNVSWLGEKLTFVLTGDNHPTDPRTTVMFIGNTQIYKWSNRQTAGMTNIYTYLGNGYPSNINTFYTAALPEFRYGTSTSHVTII